MQFDPTAILKTIEDQDFVAGQEEVEGNKEPCPVCGQAETETRNIPLTLGIAVARALQQADDNTPAEKRIERSVLAIQIVDALKNGELLDWPSEVISETKELCLKMWTHPVVYYRIDQLLEGKANAIQGSVPASAP
jgi:hypothetical protein